MAHSKEYKIVFKIKIYHDIKLLIVMSLLLLNQLYAPN